MSKKGKQYEEFLEEMQYRRECQLLANKFDFVFAWCVVFVIVGIIGMFSVNDVERRTMMILPLIIIALTAIFVKWYAKRLREHI